MDVLVAGGHGQIARRLERLLAQRGHTPRGLIRNPDHVADLEAKRDADLALETSGLAWTIVRPGRLTDEPGTGVVDVAPAGFGDIPRDDVAAVLYQCLLADNTVHAKFDLLSGDEPIEAAVHSLTPR